MKEPLQSRKRFLISALFVVVFLLFIPIILLYSIGYRLDNTLTLTPTGGMYVFYPESGAKVFLNGILSDQTSLFERGVFISDLAPVLYHVEVQKTGYLPWKKDIDVGERRVAEAYPFLIPAVVGTSTVPRFITLNSGTSVTNTLYSKVVELFATSTTKASVPLKNIITPTSTTLVASSTAIVRKDIEIAIEGKQIVAWWKGNKDSTPFYFCDADRLECNNVMKVADGDFLDVDFYPGRNDVILYTTKDGIYATELDQRSLPNTHKLLSGNFEFREDNQRVFIKEKNFYYELLFIASTTLTNAISI